MTTSRYKTSPKWLLPACLFGGMAIVMIIVGIIYLTVPEARTPPAPDPPTRLDRLCQAVDPDDTFDRAVDIGLILDARAEPDGVHIWVDGRQWAALGYNGRRAMIVALTCGIGRGEVLSAVRVKDAYGRHIQTFEAREVIRW